jgi:glutamate dehydrogenase
MMLQRSEQARTEMVKRLAARARKQVRRTKARDPGHFVEQFYANIAAEDVLTRDESALLGAALSVWSLAQTRKPDTAKIRVFNPSEEADSWASHHTVVQIVNDDMPFLVDSVTAELNRNDLTVHLVIHPVVHVKRTGDGRLSSLGVRDKSAPGVHAESMMHIEVNEQTAPETLKRIHDGIAAVLADVRAAVGDWRAMRVKLAEAIAELDAGHPPVPNDEVDETKSFLRWLENDHFTFLGYREFAFLGHGKKKMALKSDRKSGLGILRDPSVVMFRALKDGAELPPDIVDFLQKPQLLMVSKANRRSTVHRAVHLDTLGIKTFDRNEKVVGERLFVGLFTSDIYAHAVGDIPMLRRKVAGIVERSGVQPNSHDSRALMHIIETLPRDELLQVETDSLLQTSLGILHLQERQRIALFVHRDPFGRFASCLVYVPRDRYDTRLRRRMQKIIEEGFGGEVTAFYTHLTDEALARLQFIVRTTPGAAPPQSDEEVERLLIEAGRDWRDDLSHALVSEHGESKGLDLFRIHGEAFPASYREHFDTIEAVTDVARVERAMGSDIPVINLYRPDGAHGDELRLKLYHRTHPLPLSDVLPVLENMGLRVIDEIPHRIEPKDCDCIVWIHDFGMVMRNGFEVFVDAAKPLFEDALTRVWTGEIENDGFNRLVLSAGLQWRQVTVLRAACKFLLQAGIPFSQAYMEETLERHPPITCMIVRLFESLFDPDAQDRAEAQAKKLHGDLMTALEAVSSLDEDRILRRFVNLVESTRRTNYYQVDEAGQPRPWLALKLDSHALDELPLPRPLMEIFVHSPRVDAVHLRGGKVARGGIRWSDRREDFRTEILGLMKSQMTKNAVIVPVGAKGGFVLKRAPTEGGREALMAEGVECYKTFMRAMLDITDNLVRGKVVPPKRVVRRDGDDPYLVVAADKGTATFSDIANGIAGEYGFWLGDAFASGGSAGYDHKAMGITARGAWESIKRHFREIGIDAMKQPFTCVGIGDMSGDVFGNGLLYTDQVRLVGAFNHLHIFVDPDPDAKAAFGERKRLFKLPRSSWSDYDARLISKGGGVFDRSAKSIKITPQMRELFDLGRKETATPVELLRAMLTAPVDLLYFGGIGTFIKASEESNAEAGDRANDAVRVNGRQVKAKIVGEGANLGVTQRGRIEYALGGGRINADFIDNSAGVDCSDHEVNIKILCGEAMAAGKLKIEARNKLLGEMTDEVARLVLMDNYRQSMALTHALHQSVVMLEEHTRFMHTLERAGHLDRAVEFLPDDEMLDQRRAQRRGLTRPELSVLLAYAKIRLFDEVLASDLVDDPYLLRGLDGYFPVQMQKRFAAFIPGHRLKREIIATYVSNTLVNRTGPSFITAMAERSGAKPADIARAYLISRQVFTVAELWAGVESLDYSVPADVQTAMHLEILDLIRRGTLWFLKNGPKRLEIDATVKAFLPGIATLENALDDILTDELKATRSRLTERFTTNNVPEKLARRIANLDALVPACDIIGISAGAGYGTTDVGRIYYALGAEFGLDWLREAAANLVDGGPWQRMAVAALMDDLYACQTELAHKVLDLAGSAGVAPAIIDTWKAAQADGVMRVKQLVGDVKRAPVIELAMLAVVTRELRALIVG